MITSTTTSMMDHINMSKSSIGQKDPPKAQEPTTVVPSNRRTPILDGGYSRKIGNMWNIKHEIISLKFYKLLIKTELKFRTSTTTSRCVSMR